MSLSSADLTVDESSSFVIKRRLRRRSTRVSASSNMTSPVLTSRHAPFPAVTTPTPVINGIGSTADQLSGALPINPAFSPVTPINSPISLTGLSNTNPLDLIDSD